MLTPDEQKAFLERFRAKLNAEAGSGKDALDAFIPAADDAAEELVDGAVTRREPSISLTVPSVKRGAEPLPKWLKLQLPRGSLSHPKYMQIRRSMREKKLATVCEEAKCPNIGECWGGGETGENATATIMLMGDECTRGCRFCSVKTSRVPKPLDANEPMNTALAVKEMGVEYIVITMVDRDDLPDGGSHHVEDTIRLIKQHKPAQLIECLVGDWAGNLDHVARIARSGLDTYAHNVECVERITPNVRDRRATYRQSLKTLEHAKLTNPAVLTKSSIMLGLGEEAHEVLQTMKDLRSAGVQCLTLGQYLQPSATRLKVNRYVHPQEFEAWKLEAESLGFLYCASGPMVRSSYRAGEFFIKNIIEKGLHHRPAQSASA